MNLELKITRETENRLMTILKNINDQEIFAQNIIAYQISELKKSILSIRLDIRAYEDKYKMSSEKFYSRFGQGNLGDEEDFVIWAGLYEMLHENMRKLKELE
ncbi:hypothetical protein [Desulfonema magnum]|uniref:Uncharacterized protein n=1 Tax=Desulfonema magnum TaxID=45655 RepID=A0A975BI63_9BACT|nr:hypothetical protein [Desulfonema magnum]QTA85778.1 Uncharacterized protein dnm_017930 [Desulfonema magnum]